jgi:hypothetical protein
MAEGQHTGLMVVCSTAQHTVMGSGVYSVDAAGYWSPPYRMKRTGWLSEPLPPPPPPPVPFCWGPNGCLILLGYMLTAYAAAVTLAIMVVEVING